MTARGHNLPLLLNANYPKPGGKVHDPDDGMRIQKNLDPLEWWVQACSMPWKQEKWPIHKQIPRFITVCGDKKTITEQLTTS